jgi:hypothetical protein
MESFFDLAAKIKPDELIKYLLANEWRETVTQDRAMMRNFYKDELQSFGEVTHYVSVLMNMQDPNYGKNMWSVLKYIGLFHPDVFYEFIPDFSMHKIMHTTYPVFTLDIFSDDYKESRSFIIDTHGHLEFIDSICVNHLNRDLTQLPVWAKQKLAMILKTVENV